MNKVQLKYVLTAYPISEYGLKGIFASYYASSGIIDRGFNWQHGDTTCLGLLLTNVILLLSPALLGQLSQAFTSSDVKVPSKVLQMISGLYPLWKGSESYSFETDLSDMDSVRSYLSKIVSDLEECKSRNERFTAGYSLSQFSDKATYDAVLNRLIYTLRSYISAPTATHLASEIAVSLAKLRSIPGFPGPHVGISRVADFSGATVNSVPYGPRKYIPLGNGRVSFIGEPSTAALILSRLFVRSVRCEFDDGTSVVVNSPSIGTNVVMVEDKPMGAWLLSLLQMEVSSDTSAVHAAVKTETTMSEALGSVGALGKLIKPGKQKGSLSGEKSYHSRVNIDSRKWEGGLYSFERGRFRFIGRLES